MLVSSLVEDQQIDSGKSSEHVVCVQETPEGEEENDQLIQLVVRGVTDGFLYTCSFLSSVPGSILFNVFGEDKIKIENDTHEINRDPVIFKMVLDYIQNKF